MPRRPPHPDLDRLHHHPRRHHRQPPAPAPSKSPGAEPLVMVASYPRTSVNWRQYGLSPAQALQAEQRLVLANQRRPLSGPKATYLAGLRISGILRAVRAGWIGNRRWGRQLHGHRGGHAVKRYRARHLQTLPRLGAEAQQSRRDARRAQQEYDSRSAEAAPPLRSTRPWEDQGPGLVWNLDDLD